MEQKEKEFIITKQNIPLIIKAVERYGDLPRSVSNTNILFLEILLELSKNNIVTSKLSNLAEIAKCKISLTHAKIKLLTKHGFIALITSKGVIKTWKINLSKLKTIVETYQVTQELSNRISKRHKIRD